MKRLFFAAPLLLLAACGATTIAIAIALVGSAGAGLGVYCAVGGNGCSPALLSYASLITTQASEDATILESGTSTATQIAGVVSNLQMAITAAPLAGLTMQQQTEVSAIVAAVNALLPLIEKIQPMATANRLAPRAAITLPQLSSRDRAALAKMRAKIAAVKH